MPLDVITDSPRTNNLGSNNTYRNRHRDVIPTVKLSHANDFNQGESDSSSEDPTDFYRENQIVAANRRERSKDTATKVIKMPYLQAMSTESDTSTASSKSSNFSIGNRKSSIRSSTCSESDSEDGLQPETNPIIDLSKILGDLKVTEKDDEKKTGRTLLTEKDIASLLTETLKLNLNEKLDNAKYLVVEERRLSTDPLYNIHGSDNTDVSDENRDSETSDELNDSDSDDEIYNTRGRGQSAAKTNYRFEPYAKKEESLENWHDLVEKIIYPNFSQQINEALDRVGSTEELLKKPKDLISSLENSEATASNVVSSTTSDEIDKPSWLTEIPMITVDQPLSSASSRSNYSAHSPASLSSHTDQSNSDPSVEWIENIVYSNYDDVATPVPSDSLLPDLANGQNYRTTYGTRSSLYNSSGCENSPYTTDGSNIFSPASMQSSNDGMEHFDNFYSSFIPETNESETVERKKNQIFGQTKLLSGQNSNLNGIRQDSSPDHNQMDDFTAARFEFMTKTNVENVIEVPRNLTEIDDFHDTQIDDMSTIFDQLIPISRLSPGTTTTEPNKSNSKNFTNDAIHFPNTTIHNQKANNFVTTIIGNSDTRGIVTVADQGIHNSCKTSTNNVNMTKNKPSFEQNSNSIQVRMIQSNTCETKQNCNYKPNIGQSSILSNSQIQREPISKATVMASLIPTTINQRPAMFKEKFVSTRPWELLRLPESDACERLKNAVEGRDVCKSMLEVLQWPNERFFQSQGKGSDTRLMEIVRDPITLEKYLHFLSPVVQRMLRVPESFLKTDDKGRDALYLAAVNCPDKPFVTGYLAASIAELCQNNTLQLNTYRNGDTLMHAVAAQGDTHVDVMKELIAIGKKIRNLFDLSAQNIVGQTPLHLAVQAHQSQSKQATQMVRLLMRNGANPRVTENKSGNTALHMAISSARSKAIVQALLDPNVNCTAVTVRNYAGNLPIHLAASDLNNVSLETQADICRRLVDYNSPTNEPNKQNKMPLALVATERKNIMKNIFHKKC